MNSFVALIVAVVVVAGVMWVLPRIRRDLWDIEIMHGYVFDLFVVPCAVYAGLSLLGWLLSRMVA